MVWVAIAAGGAVGAMMRHVVTSVLALWSIGTPGAIFIVNAIGCALIGGLAGAVAGGRLQLSDVARVFLTVGLLGGFTTFSSFGLDTYTLLRAGRTGLAFGNAVGQMAVGVGAVWVGYALATGRP